MRPPGWFRLVRGGVFAAVCVALSQLGHDVMAGRPAPLWAGWTALAALGGLGYFLANRQRPAWWILLAVETAQVGLHLWFSYCTPPGPGPGAAPMRMPDGEAMRTVAHGGTAMAHGAGMSLGMLGAHMLAGLPAAIWLSVGERALWRALRVVAGFLVDRTQRVLTLPTSTGLPRRARPTRVTIGRWEDEVAPAFVVLRHVLVRRGPPRGGDSPAFA